MNVGSSGDNSVPGGGVRRQQLLLWSCTGCGYKNWPTRYKCRVCFQKRTYEAALVAEQWSTAVIPAELRVHAQGQKGEGRKGKGGKGNGSKGGKGIGGGGAEGVQTTIGHNSVQGAMSQPTGRKPARFRIDDESEARDVLDDSDDDVEGYCQEQWGEAGGDSVGKGGTFLQVLTRGQKRWQSKNKVGLEKAKSGKGKGAKGKAACEEEGPSSDEGDVDMRVPTTKEPVELPTTSRKLLAARQLALQKKKEELQRSEGTATEQGNLGPPAVAGRAEKRLRKVEEELENNKNNFRVAGGANVGNLKVALWHEGKRIQRMEKRLRLLEVKIEEEEEAIHEAQKRWRSHTKERD